jgi:hypothetical protein
MSGSATRFILSSFLPGTGSPAPHYDRVFTLSVGGFSGFSAWIPNASASRATAMSMPHGFMVSFLITVPAAALRSVCGRDRGTYDGLRRIDAQRHANAGSASFMRYRADVR